MEHVPRGFWTCNRRVDGICKTWELGCETIERVDCILACIEYGGWYYQVKCSFQSKFKISSIRWTIKYRSVWCYNDHYLWCTYLQFDEQLEVKFDGTKVVDLPQDHCSCKPKQGAYHDIHFHCKFHFKRGLTTPTSTLYSYIGCASKTPIGKQQKIRGNEHATISCSGGCLHFTKVMANAHPRPHYAIFTPQAMFVCSNIATIMHPSDAQKIINKKQLKLMKEKCEGKEYCSVQACDSWWNTNHKCPSHESPIMWINFHCNGIPGGAMVTREVGSCEGGT